MNDINTFKNIVKLIYRYYMMERGSGRNFYKTISKYKEKLLFNYTGAVMIKYYYDMVKKWT